MTDTDVASGTRLPRALTPFRQSAYRRLAVALVLATFAGGVWVVGLVWEVIRLDGGPAQLSLVSTAGAVGVLLVQRSQDAQHLLRGLAGAVDDLGVAGAGGAVEVDAGVAEVGDELGALRVGHAGHAIAGRYSGTLPLSSPSRNGVVTPSYIRCVTRPSRACWRLWQWSIQMPGLSATNATS